MCVCDIFLKVVAQWLALLPPSNNVLTGLFLCDCVIQASSHVHMHAHMHGFNCASN